MGESWETSDLAFSPNIPISYSQAKKQPAGGYKLFYAGTRNEIFVGELFASMSEAKNFFKVQQIKAQAAQSDKSEN